LGRKKKEAYDRKEGHADKLFADARALDDIVHRLHEQLGQETKGNGGDDEDDKGLLAGPRGCAVPAVPVPLLLGVLGYALLAQAVLVLQLGVGHWAVGVVAVDRLLCGR